MLPEISHETPGSIFVGQILYSGTLCSYLYKWRVVYMYGK